MNIGVVANSQKPDARQAVEQLCAVFSDSGVTIQLEDDTAHMMSQTPKKHFTEGADLIVSLGGDGTLLETLRRMKGAVLPVAGINIGTLGFLTTCQDEQLEAFAAAVLNQKIKIVERTMLDVRLTTLDGQDHRVVAVNEVVIARGETGRMVALEAYVDGELLNEYRADGLIVATPTGSTAYSLSAGGPLIGPGAGVFVVTPICPHSLSNRSLIVNDGAEVTIKPSGGDLEPILFTVDGREALRVKPGTIVSVQKSANPLKLVRMPDHSFYETLRRKLHWH